MSFFVIPHIIAIFLIGWPFTAMPSALIESLEEAVHTTSKQYMDDSRTYQSGKTVRTKRDAQQAPRLQSEVGGQQAVPSGWGTLDVNPDAYMSVIYKGTFRVNVYRRNNIDDTSDKAQYFYAPALIVDPSSPVCTYSQFNRRFEMVFQVVMWDEEFEMYIADELSKKRNKKIPRTSVTVLPIEQIRLDTTAPNNEYQVFDKWVSYATQPSLFEFRLIFLNNGTCNSMIQLMRDNPRQFTDNTVVHYSLETQNSAKHTITITADSVKGGKLFTKLDQSFQGVDNVYMKSDDMKDLTQEMATNVVANEVTEDRYISSDQSVQIASLLESVLQATTESSAGFDKQMWNSVFWNDDSARPDKISSTLNQFYDKSDATTKDQMVSAMKNASTSTTDDAYGFGASSSANTGASGSDSFSNNTNQDDASSSKTSFSFGLNLGIISFGASGYSFKNHEESKMQAHTQESALDSAYKNSSSFADQASSAQTNNVAGSSSSSNATSAEEQSNRDAEQKKLNEVMSSVEFDGTKFVPKPLKLSRINLSSFRSSTNIATTQARVTKTTSELTSGINVMDWASSVANMAKQREQMPPIIAEMDKLSIKGTLQREAQDAAILKIKNDSLVNLTTFTDRHKSEIVKIRDAALSNLSTLATDLQQKILNLHNTTIKNLTTIGRDQLQSVADFQRQMLDKITKSFADMRLRLTVLQGNLDTQMSTALALQKKTSSDYRDSLSKHLDDLIGGATKTLNSKLDDALNSAVSSL